MEQREKEIRYWALNFHVLEALKAGLTLAEASVKYIGEQLEAAHFFHTYLQRNKA